MASIFKLSRDKGKKNKPWYIQYFDHEGKRVTEKGFTDKGLTEQLAAKLENEAMLRKKGLIDPVAEKALATLILGVATRQLAASPELAASM